MAFVGFAHSAKGRLVGLKMHYAKLFEITTKVARDWCDFLYCKNDFLYLKFGSFQKLVVVHWRMAFTYAKIKKK